MSVKYDKFFPEVLPYVHDCPEIAALNAIRNACMEFCDKSKILQVELDPMTLLPNIRSYDIEVDSGYQPAGIMQAWSSNLPMQPKGHDDLGRMYPQDWRTMQGTPQYWTQMNYEEMVVVPYSAERRVGALRVITAIMPTRDSLEIDDMIYKRYAEIIGFGARARLYETPAQPYFDPNAAQLYRAKFLNGIGEAKISATRGLTRATMRVRPPRLV